MKALTSLILCGVLGQLASCASAPQRSFDVTHAFQVEVPAGGRQLHAWFALPDDHDDLQRVQALDFTVDAPEEAHVSTREVRDPLGNRFLFLEARDAGGATLSVETRFRVTRKAISVEVDPAATRPLTGEEHAAMAPYLEESTHIRATPDIRTRAAEVVGDEVNPLVQGRLLYDWVLDHVQYWVKEPNRLKASGVGSSQYCYEQCTGNCTDFHSLYVAAARSVGLPSRMIYGSFFKGPLDGVDADQSYHCWVEFWAPGVGWVPIDVAVADLFVDDFTVDEDNRSKVSLTLAAGYPGPDPYWVDYYFGNLEDRRVTWHRGRDLMPEPGPASGPVNALPKAHVEVDGRAIDTWTRKLTYREL